MMDPAAAAGICASCPDLHQDLAAQICKRHGIQKAFGRSGDMLDSLSGNAWAPKWEAKVVMATVTKAQTLGAKKAFIICIAGGENCDAEVARQPLLVRAIKAEMEDPDFRVRVEWMEMAEFVEMYGSEADMRTFTTTAAPGRTCARWTTSAPSSKAQAKASSKDMPAPAATSPLFARLEPKDKSAYSSTEVQPRAKASQKPLPCKFVSQGLECKKGATCPFTHAALAASHGYPSSANQQLPKAHPPKASASAADRRSEQQPAAQPCKFFKDGNCKAGSACNFSHGPAKPQAKASSSGNDKRGKGEGKDQQKSKSSKTKTKEKENGKGKNNKGKQKGESDSEEYECGQCGKCFPTLHAAQQHQEDTGHANVPVCLTCFKAFSSEASALQHQKSTGHVGIAWIFDDSDGDVSDSDESDDMTWECPQCRRLFATEQAADQHMTATGHGY